MKRSKQFKTAAAFFGALLLLATLGSSSLANTDDVRQGLPGRRISGGSRSPNTACLLNEPNSKESQKVIAIAPESNLSRTVQSRPTFWFSLPPINPDRSIEFSLINQDEEIFYTQTLQPTGKAGLAAITLPETAPTLDEDQTYKWHLSVVCDRASRATDLVVWGWVERVAVLPSRLQQTIQTNSQNRLSIYEDLNAWNDTLTALFELHRDRTANSQTTEDLEEKWTALLTAENLSQSLSHSSIASPANISDGLANTDAQPAYQTAPQ